jgi:hypothetical protein
VRVVEGQAKFYVGEVVVRILAVVVVDIVEDLLPHLTAEKEVVVAGLWVVEGEVPFQTSENLNMEVLHGEVEVQLTSFHDDLSLRAMWQFLGVAEDLYDTDVTSPGIDGMMVNLNCLHGNSLDSLLLVEMGHPEVEQQAVILAHAYSGHVSQEVCLYFPLYHSLLVS